MSSVVIHKRRVMSPSDLKVMMRRKNLSLCHLLYQKLFSIKDIFYDNASVALGTISSAILRRYRRNSNHGFSAGCQIKRPTTYSWVQLLNFAVCKFGAAERQIALEDSDWTLLIGIGVNWPFGELIEPDFSFWFLLIHRICCRDKIRGPFLFWLTS